MMSSAVLVIRQHNVNDILFKDYTTWTLNLTLIPTLTLTLTLTLTHYFDVSFYCWRFSSIHGELAAHFDTFSKKTNMYIKIYTLLSSEF